MAHGSWLIAYGWQINKWENGDKNMKTRLLVFNKWLLLLLVATFFILQFMVTAYQTERANTLEELLEEYRSQNLALKEDKRHIQDKYMEVIEGEDKMETEKDKDKDKDKETEDERGKKEKEKEENKLEEENIEGKESGEASAEQIKEEEETSFLQDDPVRGNPSETMAEGDKKKAYLTFDDGPSELTPELLDVLREHQVKATFFVNGKEDSRSLELYRRKQKEGHALGNHTYSHHYHRIYAGLDEFMEDFKELEELLASTTGTRPRIMRFPGGSNNTVSRSVAGYDIMPRIIQKVLAEGYQYFDWNIYGFDGNMPVPSSEEIARAVLHQSQQQEMQGKDLHILLHDNHFNKTTLQALPQIIEELKQKGYHFKTLTPQTPPYRFSS